LEVRLGGLLLLEQREHEVHGLPVGRLEGDGRGGAHKGAHGLLQGADAAVGYGDAVPQAGGTELLALEQAVEDARPRDLPGVLEQQPDLLEQALLAAHVQPQQDVVDGQQPRQEVHGGPRAQACGMRFRHCAWRSTWKRSLCLITCRSSLSMSSSMAAYMSASCASTWMSLPERCTVASIFWSSFSTVMITLTSITWSKWRSMRPSFDTT